MISARKKTPREILGISENESDQRKIKEAFNKLALQYHSDKNPASDAKDKFIEIYEAYRVLKMQDRPVEIHIEDKEETSPLPQKKYVADDGFNLLQFLRKTDAFEFENQEHLNKHFRDNIHNIQATLTSALALADLIERLKNKGVEDFTFLTYFDFEWLGNLTELYENMYTLGKLLSALPLDQWDMFFDHMGKAWLDNVKENIGFHSQSGLIHYIYHEELEYRYTMQYDLYEKLGLEWLRNHFSHLYDLQSFLNLRDLRDGDALPHPLLTFLNGDDQWIKKIITNGTQLGIIFEGLGQEIPSSYDAYHPPRLANGTLDRWKLFADAFLPPDFITNIVNNPVQLSALLMQLDANYAYHPEKYDVQNVKKIELFLNTYLDYKKFNSLEDLMAVLAALKPGHDEEKSDIRYLSAAAKCIHFIKFFRPEDLHAILFNKKTFEQILIAIDQHKDKPCYRALLCAVTIAYSFQRGKEPEEKSTVKFSFQQKNDSASSLILFAMNNVPVGKEWDVYLMTAPGLFNPNPGMKKLEDFCLYLFISENSLYLHLPDGTKKTITSQEIPLLDQLMPPRNHFYQPLENPKKCQDHKKFCQAVLAYTTAQGWTSQRELSGIYQGRLGQITARYTAYLNPNPGVAIRAISAITDMFNPAKYLPYKASTPAGTTPAITHKPG